MKASIVALLACVLVPVLALAQEGQAQGNLNTITSVSVRGGTVEIVGTKKPNFTTFTMTDPPRLVIDISEAVFSGVKEDLPVGNGTITGVRTASYGSDESAIARVLIGYEREVETDIQTTGNSLVVNVVGGGGAAVAARPGTPAGAAGTGAATTPGGTAEQAAVAAQTDQKQQERAAAESTVAAQADQKQQERAAAESTAAAQADQKQQERAAAQAAADAQAAAEAQRQAQARAEADRKAQEESARVAAQQAEQQRLQQERAAKEAAAAAEKQRREDEARAAAEEKKRQQAEAQVAAAASAEEKKRLAAEEKARRDAAAEEKKRLAAEARARQQEEARAAAEERKLEREEARQSRLAQAETPRRAPVQGDGPGVSSRRKTMTLVGFKQEATSSRVFVRTNEPVRYTVTEGNKQVVLELEDTGISESNNTRSLDTSFFDTAVASVNADTGPSRTVRVAIKLKEQVSFQARQDGNEVSIEFQRPARR
ncbi:AMIN domain-containing protein [Archangium lipolyticum]|uniref:AMIN domain-containing protein n=1 Tax=Archangium lipolyticum TaxID=2970465 RepID=UPI00214A26E9|nr:AMIN domain-containing protein [Archangium lipolyticum]